MSVLDNIEVAGASAVGGPVAGAGVRLWQWLRPVRALLAAVLGTALLVWTIYHRGELARGREDRVAIAALRGELAHAYASHEATLASLQRLTAAADASVAAFDALAARSARDAAALHAALLADDTRWAAQRHTVDALIASSTRVYPAGAPCVPGKAAEDAWHALSR